MDLFLECLGMKHSKIYFKNFAIFCVVFTKNKVEEVTAAAVAEAIKNCLFNHKLQFFLKKQPLIDFLLNNKLVNLPKMQK